MCGETRIPRYVCQRRATKFILNDYVTDYKTRLIKLNILPLMYTYDLYDILFFVKSIQHPSNHFNISNYVNFCRNPTRSSTSNKLQHNFTSSNKQSNFYFNRLPRTLNLFPPLNHSYSRSFGSILQAILTLTILTVCTLFALVVPAPSLLAHQTSAVINFFFLLALS